LPKIRVLVVDDSAVVRRLLTIALSRDPDIEVAGIAANGRIGLARIAELTPDLVTLDVEMPEMDGLQTLAAIRQKHPNLPVIMFSSLTERGASVSINALLAGANDYLAKPSDAGGLEATAERVRAELVPKIKALIAKKRGPAPATPSPSPAGPRANLPAGRPLERPRLALETRIEVCAVGTSTGGPNALVTLLNGLTRDLPVPLLIVQHMPPLFTRYLAERLSATTPFSVAEARDGARLAPGEVWIAPGDYHLEIVRGAAAQPQLRLHQGAPENFCRPAVDVLFRSAAACHGAGVLAVVLTGMGQDGLRGCSAVHEAGGQIVVQDEASSVVWGMPGAVAGAGLAQATLPLPDVAPEILRRLATGRVRAGALPAPAPSPATGARRTPG
jgi:two-component system, chemotaxis family, protein-glutamate methylesterase/glutaminase